MWPILVTLVSCDLFGREALNLRISWKPVVGWGEKRLTRKSISSPVQCTTAFELALTLYSGSHCELVFGYENCGTVSIY